MTISRASSLSRDRIILSRRSAHHRPISRVSWEMDQDALADEAISGWNNSFTTIKSMHVIDSRRRRQRVSRVIHMSARVRTDVGSRPTNRQILWKYCYLREHVCCRASSYRGNARGGPSPARFAGMQLAENASGRDPEDLLFLSRDIIVVRDDEGMLPAVVGYLYVTNEWPCEIASLHDIASSSEFIVRVRIIYVRQKTHI